MISVLTIGGSDSSGGAGIQNDLKTFASLGCHGLSVITAITAQTPSHVQDIEPVSDKLLREQISCALSVGPLAIKIGMLYSRQAIETVAELLSSVKVPIILDTPIEPTGGGKRLLEEDALPALTKHLINKATLITPNLPEAEALLKRSITQTKEGATSALHSLTSFGCNSILLKGGHFTTSKDTCSDFLLYNNKVHVFSSPFISGGRIRGTGCTLSSVITVFLAHGLSINQAVEKGKSYVAHLLAHATFQLKEGDVLLLNHLVQDNLEMELSL